MANTKINTADWNKVKRPKPECPPAPKKPDLVWIRVKYGLNEINPEHGRFLVHRNADDEERRWELVEYIREKIPYFDPELDYLEILN